MLLLLGRRWNRGRLCRICGRATCRQRLFGPTHGVLCSLTCWYKHPVVENVGSTATARWFDTAWIAIAGWGIKWVLAHSEASWLWGAVLDNRLPSPSKSASNSTRTSSNNIDSIIYINSQSIKTDKQVACQHDPPTIYSPFFATEYAQRPVLTQPHSLAIIAAHQSHQNDVHYDPNDFLVCIEIRPVFLYRCLFLFLLGLVLLSTGFALIFRFL